MKTLPPRLAMALLTVFAVFGVPALILRAGEVAPGSVSDTRPAQSAANLNGVYVGVAKLSDVVAGRYTDPLATPTPAPTVVAGAGKLGLDVELSLSLTQNGARLSGYVVLDRSLVFPQVAVVQATPVGPRVTGTINGSQFTIESEEFTVILAPERNIPAPQGGGPAPAQRVPEQRAQRQFRLVGTVRDDGALVGEYRETVIRLVGNLPAPPSTALGPFQLNPPLFAAAPTPRVTPLPQTNRLYLPLISRDGP